MDDETKRKRAGRLERDDYLSLLSLAFQKEYIGQAEYLKRSGEAAEASHMGDLDRLVSDLPSRLEMESKIKTPGRVRRLLANSARLKESPWSYVALLAAGLILAIGVSVFLGNLPLYRPVKYASVAVSIVTGVVMVMIAFIASENKFSWM